MNGAKALLHTLVGAGIDVCFANPGTSEMHFVAALDAVPQMRGVLTLFEGVATGAADGYGRMRKHPAATLLHLGPGLANGLANLHNARRARTPLLNVVGDHATYHKQYDTPLESDVSAFASPVSKWIRVSTSPDAVAKDASDAIAAALSPPSGVATLVLPADVSWQAAAAPPPTTTKARFGSEVPASRIDGLVRILRSGEPCALLVGGNAVDEASLTVAARIAQHCNASLLCDTFTARLERGAGRPVATRVPYLAELALQHLQPFAHLILVDTKAPVAFFAYPNLPSSLVPTRCQVHALASPDEDAHSALAMLADATGATGAVAPLQELDPPGLPSGDINARAIGQAIGALLPAGAIVSDEGNTQGLSSYICTAASPPHSWLSLMGGSIGQGMPLATGAAIACPDRKVINIEADGSSLYTFQALWTQVRERLDVTTVLLNNRSYGILNMELGRVGATPPGPRALSMLDLSRPDIDYVKLAEGLGANAERAVSAEHFVALFRAAMSETGPHFIEVVL